MNSLVSLTELIIKKLVEDPDSVSVKEFDSDEDNTILIEVMVSENDMAKVIKVSSKILTFLNSLNH